MNCYNYSELRNTLMKFNEKIAERDSKLCEKVCKRLLYFADYFQRNFKEKICAYEEEAIGRSVKPDKRLNVLQKLFMGVGGFAGGIVLGFSGVKPGIEIAKHSEKALVFFDKHKDKAVSVTIKFKELVQEDSVQTLFITVGVRIFSIYEQQLMTIFNNEEWLVNIETLIKDAIKKIINHVETLDDETQDTFEKIIMEPFTSLIYKPKTLLSSIVKRSKSVVKKSSIKWTFERINRKSGFVVRRSEYEEMNYYWREKEHPKFGFKLMPSHLIDKEEPEYKGEFIKYNHLLELSKMEKLNAIVETIKKIIANSVTGNSKDIHSSIIEENKKLDKLENEITEGYKQIMDVHKKVNKILNLVDDKERKKNEENKIKIDDIIPPVVNFTGRKNELNEIHEKINCKQSGGRISQTVCICGMGGIGKTELSRKYIEVYSLEYEHKYWINAEDSQNIFATANFYNEIIEKTKQKTLIIFDNVNTIEDAKMLFPKQHLPHVFILITSRITTWNAGTEGKIEIVELFDFAEALEFITNSFPDEERKSNITLIHALHNLPLALQQAVSYIKNKQEISKMFGEKKYSVLDYVNEFKVNSRELLDSQFAKDSIINDRYLETVYSTWNVSFEQIKNDKKYGDKAVEIMRIISYLEPSFNIKTDLIDNGLDINAILLLNKYSIINIHEGWGNMHRLIQKVIRIQTQHEPNLEEAIFKKIIFFKRIFLNTRNLNLIYYFCKYPKTVEEYCKRISISEIPLFILICNGYENLFEIMMQYFDWNDETVRNYFSENINMLYNIRDVNIIKNVLEKSQLLKSYSTLRTFVFNAADIKRFELVECLMDNLEEIDQCTFKLIILLHKKIGKEALEYLTVCEKDNLHTVIKERTENILRLAIDINYPGLVECLLKNVAEQFNVNHLWYAIMAKKYYAFEELVSNEYIIMKYKDIKGMNIFDYVCSHETLRLVKHLENAGFTNNINLTFHLNFYDNCKLEVFNYLLDKNNRDVFDLKAKVSQGRTALFYATCIDRIDLIKCLVEKNQSIDITDINRNTLLHYAVASGIKGLLIYKINALNRNEIINFLIKVGVDPLKCNSSKQPPFFLAAYRQDIESIKILLEKEQGKNLNECDLDGRTPFHYAAMSGQYNTIKEITKNLYSSTQENNFTFSPHIENFLFSNDLFFDIRILLNFNANLKAHDKFDCTPTHYICMFIKELSEWELLDLDMSLSDSIGNTPLHFAAIAYNVELLLLLLFKKDNSMLNVVNNYNQNLLHYLADFSRQTRFPGLNVSNYIKVIELLIIKKGLDIILKDDNGYTPLHYARLTNNDLFIKTIFKLNLEFELGICFDIKNEIEAKTINQF